MKRGCLYNALFALLVVACFGLSTYFWFNFFVKGKSLPTPNLLGKSVADARATCSDLGVTLVVDEEHRRNSDKIAAGNVVWQNRTAGAASFIKRGTMIRVELSAGPLVLSVPDLTGQRAGTALLRLGQQNLKLGNLSYFEGSALRGIVAADPPTGTIVGAQTPVSLLVASPPAPSPYVMPDLIDHSLEEVRPYLESKGLAISAVKFEVYPGIPDGIIIRQYPLRGAPISQRDALTVVVSKQEETSIIDQPGAPAAATTTQ
ncbi:MAG TPA: PASTA domain-containing protein [Thermoanaerobaculia bacterium]|nr:PASTA domain-containing protein [Thermoanaerobaculia bacterium]